LTEHLPDDFDSTSALSVPSDALKWKTTQDGAKMLDEMQNLYNAVQQPGDFIQFNSLFFNLCRNLQLIKDIFEFSKFPKRLSKLFN